ncbi:M56 family metallopeptidase [Candidatus Roizmanbacteria bacterium]|nr:M56 family metallopeptidase [Candidatus Roizmanbacteria bacterium]
MIRVNKNLVIFLALIFLLGSSSLLVLQKLLPLAAHTIYYCQSFLNSLSMPIPYYLSTVPFLFFFTLLLITAIKLFIIFVKVQLSKKKLIRSNKFDIGLTSLLEKLQLTDRTFLIESEKQFAFCLGVRSPKIYISTSLVNILTIQELEAVLHHERYHLNNRDTLTMLIASVGESLLPFFPLLSDFLHNYRVEREIKADIAAIRGLGNAEPLISVLKKLLIVPSAATVGISAIADKDTLEPRINALVKKDFHFKKFKALHILISLASVFVMSIITLTPVQAFEIYHMGEDVVMICPQNNECITACRQEYSAKRKNYSENMIYTPIQ